MYFIGIDPGKTGGYAAITEDGEHDASSQFLDWSIAGIFLKSYFINGPCLVALEQVGAMPGQGVKSMFTFGANYGGWQALLEYLSIPYILVPPKRWQKGILGVFPKGESKERAYSYITRRYPHCQIKKSYTGVIDAICLALYIKDNH